MNDEQVTYKEWGSLRNMLLGLTISQKEKGTDDEIFAEFDRLLTIVHFCAIKAACIGIGALQEIGTKAAVSLLRYTDILPADKAFYEAGIACRKLKWNAMAFVFLNRFIDLHEAIEERDLDGLDHVDFRNTDIPSEIPLPEEQFIDDDTQQEIRDYILSESMDQQSKCELPKDERGIFVASLKCDNLSFNKEYPMCIVTGYPVLSNAHSFGSRVSNKEDWNRFVMTTNTTRNPFLQDITEFFAKWCGASEVGSYAFN